MFSASVRVSAWSQLALLLCCCGVGLLLASLLMLPLAQFYLHVPPEKLQDALLNSTNVNLLRNLQLMSTFFAMGLPAFIFARVIDRKPFSYLGFNRIYSGKQAFIIVGFVLLSLFISGALSQVTELIPLSKQTATYFDRLENEYNKQMMALAQFKSPLDFVFSLLILALLPAIFEEVMFRGCLQPILIRISRNEWVGICITAVLFSAVHASYYGFLPRLFLGIMLGAVYNVSKNIWHSVTMHFLFNGFLVTEMYAISLKGPITEEALNNDTVPILYGIFGLAMIVIMFRIFKQESQLQITMHNLEKYKENDDEGMV